MPERLRAEDVRRGSGRRHRPHRAHWCRIWWLMVREDWQRAAMLCGFFHEVDD